MTGALQKFKTCVPPTVLNVFARAWGWSQFKIHTRVLPNFYLQGKNSVMSLRSQRTMADINFEDSPPFTSLIPSAAEGLNCKVSAILKHPFLFPTVLRFKARVTKKQNYPGWTGKLLLSLVQQSCLSTEPHRRTFQCQQRWGWQRRDVSPDRSGRCLFGSRFSSRWGLISQRACEGKSHTNYYCELRHQL